MVYSSVRWMTHDAASVVPGNGQESLRRLGDDVETIS